MSPCTTFHTIYIAMNCLFAACLEKAETETLLCLPEGCANLSLSHFYICVSVRLCVCVLQGIMADQTWLCGRCKFNHISLFFFPVHFRIWFSPSSECSHMERYWERCFVHAKLNIYQCSTDAFLTGTSVNLETRSCKIREIELSGALLIISVCLANACSVCASEMWLKIQSVSSWRGWSVEH